MGDAADDAERRAWQEIEDPYVADEPHKVTVEDYLLDILDLTTGWCAPKTDSHKLEAIYQYATAALYLLRAEGDT